MFVGQQLLRHSNWYGLLEGATTRGWQRGLFEGQALVEATWSEHGFFRLLGAVVCGRVRSSLVHPPTQCVVTTPQKIVFFF